MDKVMDVLIEDGLIKKKAENIQCDADKVIGCTGMLRDAGINRFTCTF